MQEDVENSRGPEGLKAFIEEQLSQGGKGEYALARKLLELARLATGNDSHGAADQADEQLQDVLEALMDAAPVSFDNVLHAFDALCVYEVDELTSAQLYGHVESLTELQFDEHGNEYLAFGVNVLVEHDQPANQRWSDSGLAVNEAGVVQALQDYRMVCDLSRVKVHAELLDANVAGCLTFAQLRRAASLLHLDKREELSRLFSQKARELGAVLGPLPEGSTQVLCLFGVVSGDGTHPFPLAGDFYAAQKDGQPWTEERSTQRAEALKLAAGALAKALPVKRAVLDDAPFGWWSDDRAGSRFIRDLLASQALQQLCSSLRLAPTELLADDQLQDLGGRYPQAGIQLYVARNFAPAGTLPFPVLPHENLEEFRTCVFELLVANGVRVFKRTQEGYDDEGDEGVDRADNAAPRVLH